LLQITGSSGGALDNRVFLNSKAPSTGYFGTYMKSAQKYLPSSNLLSPTVELMGKTAFTETLSNPNSIKTLNASAVREATSEKNISVRLTFYTPEIKVNNLIAERITSAELQDMAQFSKEIGFSLYPEMLSDFASLKSATTTEGTNYMNRSTYLLIEVADIPESSIFKQGQETEFLDAATAYLKSIFTNEFKFGATARKIDEDEAKNQTFDKNCRFLQLDMMDFMSDQQDATVVDALEFDALAFKKNFPQGGTNIAFSPLLQKIKGSTQSSTTFDEQVVGLKNPLDDCEDSDELLKDLYITAKGTDALRYANKRIKKLHALYKKIVAKPIDYDFVSYDLLPAKDVPALKLLNTSAQFVLLLDLIKYFAKSKHRTAWGTKKPTTSAYRSRFTYTTAGEEEMSFPPELVKPQKKKPKGKPKKFPILPRTTSRNLMLGKSEKLALFYEELKKLIAGNESTAKNRFVPEQIVIVPLRGFRPYRPERGKKPGHDRNSRHFYNRAVDFSVFIINKINNKPPEAKDVNNLQEIPSEDVFQIPSDIVYLYVLRLMQLKNNFKGGLALFTRGQNKKFSYNHYEYMQDASPLQEVAKTRRWCNPPKKAEKKLLIGQLFYSTDASKDDIVKSWVSNNYTSETIGGLPQKIEFLVE